MPLYVSSSLYCMKSACWDVGILPRKDEYFLLLKRNIKITRAPVLTLVHIIYLWILPSQLSLWLICGVWVNRQPEYNQVFAVISGRCGISLILFSPEFDMTNGVLLPLVLTYVLSTLLRNRHRSIQLGFNPEK